MMILNLVVSIVCIVFCWLLLTLVIKGWACNDAHKSAHTNTTSIPDSRDGPITV